MNNEQAISKAKQRYERLQVRLEGLPWILNGSVMQIAPRTESPNAKTTYTWTRKIKAKTVTVSLSKQQYLAFRKAIEAHRKVERTLQEMREISERTLLASLPGVKRRTGSKSSKI